MKERIHIKRLKLETHIGVPAEERATAQELCVSVALVAKRSFEELNDEIDKGVDYFHVCQRIKTLAAQKPRKLIETLALDIANMILEEFEVLSVNILIEKYILSDTDYVGVELFKEISS